jgi:hypothetical protein
MLGRKGTLALLALVAAPLLAQAPPVAPTAEQIVARYVEKVGGLRTIESVNTLRRTGKFRGGGGF